jgi:hypothetical protein
MQLSRTATICIALYVIGVLLTASLAGWSAIESGALRREHYFNDWVLITVFYGLTSLLWPVLAVVYVVDAVGWIKLPPISF